MRWRIEERRRRPGTGRRLVTVAGVVVAVAVAVHIDRVAGRRRARADGDVSDAEAAHGRSGSPKAPRVQREVGHYRGPLIATVPLPSVHTCRSCTAIPWNREHDAVKSVIESPGHRFQQYVDALRNEAPRPTRIRSATPTGQDRIGRGPAGGRNDYPAPIAASEPRRSPEHVEVGSARIQVVLVRPVKQRERHDVDEQSRPPHADQHPDANGRRVAESVDRLEDDPDRDADQRRPVGERARISHRRVAVRLPVVAGRAPMAAVTSARPRAARRSPCGRHLSTRQRTAQPPADRFDDMNGRSSEHQPEAPRRADGARCMQSAGW